MNFSIIVPTYNRRSLLIKLYDTLLILDYDPASVELIIVDDGSSDGTDKLLASLQNDPKRAFSFRYELQTNQGPAGARNTGIKLARHDWIIFTDDDCLVSEQWVSAYAEKIVKHREAEIFHGPTITRRADVTMLTHQIDNPQGSVNFPTCNICYSRNLLKRIEDFHLTSRTLITKMLS